MARIYNICQQQVMNIRDPGNPQGVWGTVPPMPQDYQSQVYQLPADIIFTLTEQNRRLAVHEEKEKRLESALGEAKKQAMYAAATVEMMKTKTPYLDKRQYLQEDTDSGTFLELVSINPNTRKEARIIVCNTIVIDAFWVEGEEGTAYLSLLCRQADTGKEMVIHLPEKDYEKDRRLINAMTKFSVRLRIDVPLCKKATLFRDYFASKCNGEIVQETKIPWTKRGSCWTYTRAADLPWWDRRKTSSVLEEWSDKYQHTAMAALKRAFSEDRGDEEKILQMLPYAAALRPLVAEYGCTGPALINIVFPSWHPDVIHKICEITGEKEVHSLPTGNKKMLEYLRKSESICICRIDSSEMTMQERNLLIQNIGILKKVSEQEKVVVICSDAPVLLCGNNICVIEFDENMMLKYGKYRAVKSLYEKFLTAHSDHLARLIRVNKVPRQLGDFGSLYELVRLAELTVREMCGNYFCEDFSVNDNAWLVSFFERQARDTDRDGLGMQFLDCLKSSVELGMVNVITPFETLSERSVVTTDDEIYFRKDTMRAMLSGSLRGYNVRSILRDLHKHGILIANEGVKVEFQLRRRCTDSEGNAIYPKCLVLRRRNVIREGEPDFF